MKISLHIEADTTEEFEKVLAALNQRPVKWVHVDDFKTPEEEHVPVESPTVVEPAPEPVASPQVEEPPAQEAAPALRPIPEAEAIAGLHSQPAPEGWEGGYDPEMPVHMRTKEPAERKRRGRRPKTVPLTERAPEVAPAPAAAKSNGPAGVVPVTRDDFNAACRAYVTSYGLNFAQVDAPKLLQPVFGEHIRRSADIEEKDFAAATELMLAAVSANPFNRKRIPHG